MRTILAQLQSELDRALSRLAPTATVRSIHECRVAARVFKVASDGLRRKPVRLPTRRLSGALRELLQDLGPLRDADVRLQTLQRFVRGVGRVGAGWQDLVRMAAAKRDQLRGDLSNLTKSARWAHRLERIAHHAHSLDARLHADTPALDAVRKMIRRRDRRLRWRLRRAPRSPTKIHQLRLRIKELRYLLATFAPLCVNLDGMSMNKLVRLQRRIGAFHDLWCLYRWRKAAAPGHPARSALRKALCASRERMLLRTTVR